jgi:carbamoyl-phosphate synthase large subunit
LSGNVSDRFLVTGVSGDVGSAIGRILAEKYPAAERFGTDISGACKWRDRRIFPVAYALPRGADKGYLACLRKVIELTKATAVIPTSEEELRALSAHSAKISDLPILMNEPEIILRCLDKLETARWLDEIGVPVPITKKLLDAESSDLPVIVKPRFSRGSKGIEIVRSVERLRLVQKERDNSAVAQSLLDVEDSEFTCALFRAKSDDRTLTMRRTLVGGMTSRIMVEQHEAIDRVLKTILANLPDRALINVQLRMTEKGPYVFEINPRVSGTVMMRHRVGFSDLVWWIETRHGGGMPSFITPEGAMVFRAYNEIVVQPQDVQ